MGARKATVLEEAKKIDDHIKEVHISFTVADLSKVRRKLPQKDGSVASVEVLYLLAYLPPHERIAFVNELHRVMMKGAKCQIVTPHWCSSRAYADLRMEYPPVAEAWYFNLNADYRKQDPNGDARYKCDFDATWGFSLHPLIQSRNHDFQQDAITFKKEAAQDLICTIIKR